MSTTEQMIVENQLREPKSSKGVYDLPCGFIDEDGVLHGEVVVREITGAEEDILAAPKMPAVKKMNELFARCVERLGTISDKEKIAAAVPRLLVGDRVFLMFALRRASLGDDYPFKEKCPECEVEGLFNVDLSTMAVRPMSDCKKRIHDLKLPSGKAVRWHALDGAGEAKLQNIAQRADALSLSVLARLDLLDGKPPTMEAVKILSLNDRNALRDDFEDKEGGVDTETEMACSSCGAVFMRDIDVGQKGFFFPSRTPKNSKKRSSF